MPSEPQSGSHPASSSDELFLAAAALPPADRDRFLKEQCPDEKLRDEIASLLEYDQETGDFLDEPVLKPLMSMLDNDQPPPESIGQYKIESVLGTGGMGIVYRATSERPRRTVALKVIRSGIATPSVLRRFEHEAQVLAMLQHPGIAQIYETGMADTGHGPQPFFAMELVDGPMLTRYVRSRELDTRQRLEVFAEVCDAIHHAHLKGIVHRDIKPGNILVNQDGSPKVLDFGVARITDADVRTTTIRTNIGQIVGTLTYMSPEQVSTAPGEVDTRADIYSLGVVLYELLTDTLPHDLRRVPFPEAVRTICESDPTPISNVSRIFRGDVETIVRKALEKDRDLRYQSATDLADDIRRFLRDEPIIARKPSTAYQVRKFARRNKALVGGIVGIFLALVLGIIATATQAHRAGLARTEAEQLQLKAEQEANTHKEITRLLQQMLALANPNTARGTGITVNELLEAAADELSSFDGNPEVLAALHHTIGTTFNAVGEFVKAESHLQQATTLHTTALGSEHPATVRSTIELGTIIVGQNPSRAVSLSERALESAERVLPQTDQYLYRAMSLRSRALYKLGELQASVELLERALQGAERYLGENDPITLDTMMRYGSTLMVLQEIEQAESVIAEALARSRAHLGGHHTLTLDALSRMSQIHMRRGRIDEAEACFAEALQMRRQILGNDHLETRNAIHVMAAFYQMHHRYEDAVVLAQELIDRTGIVGESIRSRLGYRRQLSNCFESLGRTEEAIEVLRDGIAAAGENFGSGHEDTVRITNDLAKLLRRHSRADEARSLLEPFAQEALEAEHPRRAAAAIGHAGCLVDLGEYDDAERRLLDLHERVTAVFESGDPVNQVASELVALYEALGDVERAAAYRFDEPDPDAHGSR